MFVIVRHQKHHSMSKIEGAAGHTMRTRPTPNADPSGPHPEVWMGSQDPANDVRALLPEKRRKNAVLSIELLLTASPAFFKEHPPEVWRSYLKAQLEMIGEHFGGMSNIASAVLHTDESTPHLAVQVVPLVNGKLNARALIGTPQLCRQLQDAAGEVGKRFGLQRGTPGSRATHEEIRHWYTRMDEMRQEMTSDVERVKTQGLRLVSHLADLKVRELDLQKRKKQLDDEREKLSNRALELDAETARLRTERQRFLDVFDALDPARQAEIAKAHNHILTSTETPQELKISSKSQTSLQPNRP